MSSRKVTLISYNSYNIKHTYKHTSNFHLLSTCFPDILCISSLILTIALQCTNFPWRWYLHLCWYVLWYMCTYSKMPFMRKCSYWHIKTTPIHSVLRRTLLLHNPAISLLDIYPDKTIIQKDNMHPYVHSNTVHNSQDTETN